MAKQKSGKTGKKSDESEKTDKKNPVYKLKNYDELKSDYDLTEEITTFRAVMGRMSEIIEDYLKTLGQLLQPEEFYSLHECNAFDENDKEKILELYKSLIVAHRELLKAEILNDDAKSVTAISLVHLQIKKAKPDMVKILGKMQDSWKESYSNSTARYFG